MDTADRWARNTEEEAYGSAYFAQPDTREELLTSQARDSNRTPRAELAAYNRELYPTPVERRQPTLGITDVLGETRLYSDSARDYSGSPAGFTGSLRYSMGGW